MDKIESRYTGEKGAEYHANKHFLNDGIKEMIAKHRIKKLRRFITPDTVFLEYGVGGGFNIRNVDAKEKHGFDIAISVKEQIEELGVKFFNVEKDVPNDYYDLVLCNHVLEHVPNPPATLEVIKSKMKDNGRLLLVLPYERAWRFAKYNPNDKNYHLYSWNVQTLTYLVKLSGYEVLETKVLKYGYDRFIASLISRFKLPNFMFNPIYHALNFIRPEIEIMLVLKKAA